MAGHYSSPVTASQVGSYFVQQYYQVLQQQPESVHQFYSDSSTMIRVDGESTDNASAIFQIHTVIQSLHFSGIEIKTINALPSWSDGIVVVVSGSVRSKNFSGWRKFVQTFFLAPQDKGYFVMNDVFHFVSEEVINHVPPPFAAGHKDDFQPINSTSELLVSEDVLEVEARDNFNSLQLEGENQGNYYYSEENQHLHQEEEDGDNEDYEEEPPVDEPYNPADYVREPLHQNAVEYAQESFHHRDPVEYVQEPIQPSAEVPPSEPVKFTYASILQSKGKSLPSVPAQAPVVKSAPLTNDWSVPSSTEWDQPPEPVTSFVPESTPQVTEEALVNDEGESKSVYVRNLPTSVTSLEIFQEFKNFGKIKQDGVFLKNRKDVGICFAFVEFDDISSVRNAIEASPIQLAGRQVYIEGRRAGGSSISSSRGGRGGGGRGAGRGRGSYNDASSRGRDVSSNGRGNGFRNY